MTLTPEQLEEAYYLADVEPKRKPYAKQGRDRVLEEIRKEIKDKSVKRFTTNSLDKTNEI